MIPQPKNWRQGLALTAAAIVLGLMGGAGLYARLDDATRTAQAAIRLVREFFPTNRP
jgi:hypothetical protein